MESDEVRVDDSILLSIKKFLGMDPETFTQYDVDITLHINAVIETLNQIGVDSPEGFSVSDKNTLWTDYLIKPVYLKMKDTIKSYIYMRVRLIFDPPTNTTLLKAMNDGIKEYEWRIQQGVELFE